MPRIAKARLTEDLRARLNRGETVTINLPPGVSQLRLSLDEGDDFAYFDRIFSNVFRRLLRRLDNSASGTLK